MKTKIVRVISILMLVTIFISTASQPGFVSASSPTTALEQTTNQPPGPIDPQELEAFMDDLLAFEMAEKHIPGAMVAVVQDGNLLLTKGYGYANLEGQVPVDPERTLFRVASVSKLFMWTAVMQLVEQGQLSLDTDINEYLNFPIPASFPEPVTMRHLMSHTPGFEEIGLNNYKLQAEQMSPLGDWLKANLLGFISIFADILPGFRVPRMIFENVPMLNALLSLSYVLGALALAMLVFTVLAWVRRYWSLSGRIFYTLLAIMALLLTWWLLYWNLL